MLPSELLRYRTSRGTIAPIFCPTDSQSEEYAVASQIISEFTDAQKKKSRKGELYSRVSALETEYDYKLVRGLCALLDRRSTFVTRSAESGAASTAAATVDPAAVRQTLFVESARNGLALSDLARLNIIREAARLHSMSEADISNIMWADLDANLLVAKFDTIGAKDLLLWYNMSLAQTLLFRCTRLEFYVKGGLYWKNVLRAVKMRGLMYTLEPHVGRDKKDDSPPRCILEGPLSIFKMTDRYGTAIAELLPMIARNPTWSISASIIRRTDSGKKMYVFEMSSDDTKDYIRQVSEDMQDTHITESAAYDSSTEQRFAKILSQHLDQGDPLSWKIKREPDPLIAGGKAMIPDFVLERFGRKVYLEIVGFWTPDYVQRKAAKLRDILASSDDKGTTPQPRADLLVAVDSSLPCSQITGIEEDGIFTFDRQISVKPILDHLHKIDRVITEEAAANTQMSRNDTDADLLSIRDAALRYNVPEDSIPIIVEGTDSGMHIQAGSYLIHVKLADTISKMLDDSSNGDTNKFVDACSIMDAAKIPESCHADLLSSLGYDVVWSDLNPANARIQRTRKEELGVQ